MFRSMMKSKVHRVTVTATHLEYAGSITIDEDLIELADLLPHEHVHVLDIDNGARFETYVLAGRRGSGEICINGAAARLVYTGDKIIVLSYAIYSEAEARVHSPTVVVFDDDSLPRRLEGDEHALCLDAGTLDVTAIEASIGST